MLRGEPGGERGARTIQQPEAERDARSGEQQALKREQREDLARAGTQRTQDGELAAALAQACQHHRHHARQADHDHQGRDREQRALGDADEVPQLLQGRTGQDGGERFAGVGVDLALHAEHRAAAVQPDERGRDGFGAQVELAHLLGRDLQARDGRAAMPIDMNRLQALQAHQHGAVERRGAGREDADHGEGLVGVLGEARSALPRAAAVAEHDALAEAVTMAGGDLGADHGLEEVLDARGCAGERAAGREDQTAPLAMAVLREEVRGGADHAVTAVRVAERERYQPLHLGQRGDVLDAGPRQVGGGVADVEDRVQQQLHRAAARAHHQVGGGNRLREARARIVAQALDPEQQRHCQRHRDHGERGRQPAVGDAAQRQHEDGAHRASSAARPARTSAPRSSTRSKCAARRWSWLTKSSAAPTAAHSSSSRSMKVC
ncbi:MAG: hypothetical protein BWZ09_00193 [Alphaproteobacteria bacterium ADurb.BinA305]|nr:MAG: hypothetical protein BWZ09_00193 [Alphaproteobacteria bacterium ADurb.BinA305]